MELNSFFVYILFSINYNRFYIGQTNDFKDRLKKHNAGTVRSTMPYIPWTLIGFIQKPTRREALILERKLKNLNTEDLKKFITKHFSDAEVISLPN